MHICDCVSCLLACTTWPPKTGLKHPNLHKIENVNGWNGREWIAGLPSTCGIENCPLVFPQRAIEVRGKNFLYWVKIWNGVFYFYFGLFIEIILKYGFLTYSF